MTLALAFSICPSTFQEAPTLDPSFVFAPGPWETALMIKSPQAGSSPRSMHHREWVVILQSLQGHLREIPLSVFLAPFHAQRQKLKVNQQKVPELLMPLKAQLRAKECWGGNC